MATQRNNETIILGEFLPHSDALYNFACYLTGDEHSAADLVQETMLRAINSVDKYREGTNAKAWLFKILKNLFINDYRKEKRQPDQVDFNDVANLLPHDDDAHKLDYLDIDLNDLERVLDDEMAAAIQSLRHDYRIVFLMYDLEDFKYDEIAEVLEIPIGTVRSRLHRARNTLANKLQAYGLQQGYTDYRNL